MSSRVPDGLILLIGVEKNPVRLAVRLGIPYDEFCEPNRKRVQVQNKRKEKKLLWAWK